MISTPQSEELARLTGVWREERKKLRDFKALLLLEGKTVREIRSNREYREIRKNIKYLVTARRQCNAKQNRFLEREKFHE